MTQAAFDRIKFRATLIIDNQKQPHCDWDEDCVKKVKELRGEGKLVKIILTSVY